MIRNSGGCNDHPDPTAFVLTFRLMCMYSLVRPSGSNVTGEELFESLLKDCDTSNVTHSLDAWKGIQLSIVTNIEQSCDSDDPDDYDEMNTPTARSEEDKRLLQFLGGFVAMKGISSQRCEKCADTLVQKKTDGNNNETTEGSCTTSLLDLRNYHNVLHYPSNSLFKLVSFIETFIDAEIASENIASLSPDTFSNIVDALCNAECPQFGQIGCGEHRFQLLSFIIKFYLTLRMHFITKQYNISIKNVNKAKELRKMGKLIQGNKSTA